MLGAILGGLGGSALGGGLASLFQGNSSDAASGYLNQIPGMLHQTYDPYIKQGNEQYGGLNSTYGQMGQNPVDYLESLLKRYKPSEAYKLQRDEALQAAGNTAAAGGMRGSFKDMTDESRLAAALQSQDMQQWLQNVMGIQQSGLGGQQHLYDAGYGAASQLGGDLSNVMGSQAQNAFQGQNQRNQNLANLFSMGGGLAGAGLGSMWGSGGSNGVGHQLLTPENESYRYQSTHPGRLNYNFLES